MSGRPSEDLPGGGETIVALATPGGRSALAVIRCSGPEALTIGERLVVDLHHRPWRAQYRDLVDAEGEVLDDAVVIPFRAPKSFTGEDAIELIVHGVPVVVREILQRLLELGARIARPGELSRRAVANGRLELLEAESLGALFEASSRADLRAARRALGGELASRYRHLLDELLDARAELVAALDYADQEVEVDTEAMARRRASVLTELKTLIACGRRRRGTPRIVLAGPPNAGKSTLFNALLGFERALVSELAGTTRDHLEAELRLGDHEVLLIDTAGLDLALDDSLDRRAQEQTRQQLAEADLIVAIDRVDRDPLALEVAAPVLRVASHGDLSDRQSKIAELSGSLLDGEFVAAVAGRLAERLESRPEVLEGPAVSLRQVEALERAQTHVLACDFDELELAAEELELARRALVELVGPEDPEALYDRLFASFCLGK